MVAGHERLVGHDAVEQFCAASLRQFTDLLQIANERSGPFLIELMTA